MFADPVAANLDAPSGHKEDEEVEVAGVGVGQNNTPLWKMGPTNSLPTANFENQCA